MVYSLIALCTVLTLDLFSHDAITELTDPQRLRVRESEALCQETWRERGAEQLEFGATLLPSSNKDGPAPLSYMLKVRARFFGKSVYAV